jgi:surface protein
MNTLIKNNSLLIRQQSQSVYDPNKLVLVHNTNLGNVSKTIYVPIQGSSPNVTVDWGDGLSDVYTTTGWQGHTYASHGTYLVQISGTMRTLSYGTVNMPITGTKEKLIECLSFGNIGLNSLSGGFSGCTNLTKVPSSIPSAITNITNLFLNCSNFNDSAVSSWNTSNITIMASTFSGCSLFNQNINSWDVRKVTSFQSMFNLCSVFNQPLNNWILRTFVLVPMSTQSMFNGCSVFNQDISSWDMGRVQWATGMFSNCTNFNQPLNSWDTSKVFYMNGIFNNATSFNQPLNNWVVDKVYSFANFFNNADSFNQDLSSWNISNINVSTGLDNFMINMPGLSTANYDALLIAWNNNKISQEYRTDLKPNFGGSKYSSAGASARAALIAYGWTITDGGLAP